MSRLGDIVALFRKSSPNIARAFDEVELRLVALETLPEPPLPPAGNKLRYRPPVLTNAQQLTVTGPGTYNLGSGDWIVKMGTVSWPSSASGRSGIFLNGGRNIQLIGGAIRMTPTNNLDDATGLLIDGGVDGGVVHLEGLDIQACNGITVRTRRRVQIQNCRISVKAWRDDHDSGSGVHPDIVQVWGTGIQPGGIHMHRVTGFTTYTGLVCLESDPLVWERYDVDLHPAVNDNGTLDAGNYAYMCNGATGAAGGPYCEYRGEVYAELPTGGGGAYLRGIDDITCLRSLVGGLKVFPYEIRNPAGTAVYTSPDNPVGGSGRSEARTNGNYLTYSRVPKFAAHKWIIGRPPGGEFCPAGLAGPSYVSPGYL